MERHKVNKLVGLFYALKPLNRRKHPRFKLTDPIGCKCIYTESGEQKELLAYIVDVSRGGFLLMTGESKIYSGTELRANFKLPNHQEELSICCKVVRTYRRHSEVTYYSGTSDNSGSKEAMELLLNFACSK